MKGEQAMPSDNPALRETRPAQLKREIYDLREAIDALIKERKWDE